MDHPEATRIGAVERYLLDEMSARERGEFEEHFFDCPQCAADVKATAGFLDAARRELQRDATGEDLADGPGPPTAARSRLARLWKPAFTGWAATLLLCIVVYQNAVMFPRLTPRPSTPATLFLVGGNTRGGTIPSVTVSRLSPLLLSVDIPTADAYGRYSCVLVAQSGATVWSLPVTAEQARDTVPIVVPTTNLSPGDYKLVVRGFPKASAESAGTDLAQYRFTVNNSNN